jgi:hypothetical protein
MPTATYDPATMEAPSVAPPARPGSVINGLDQIWNDIEKYGLVRNVAELEALGFTVIPPEQAAPPGFADRMLDAVLDHAERSWGVRLDPDGELPHAAPDGAPERLDWEVVRGLPRGGNLYNLLRADPVFEQAIVNPVPLALVTYLLGYQCILSSYQAWFKGPNTKSEPNEFPLHSDGLRVTTAGALVEAATCQYLLTDQSMEHGATAFVPGSHRLLRPPVGLEIDERVPVTAPKGSVVVWNANIWHGSFTKVTPGLRISVVPFFTRPQFRQFDIGDEPVTEEMLSRNPARFATLLGTEGPWSGRAPSVSDNKKVNLAGYQSVFGA